MKLNTLVGLLLALFLMSACWGAVADLVVTDDRGELIRLHQPARRILSLAPHATELLFAAGAGDRLAGAVAWSDYPAAARHLPGIGDANLIDMERVVSLHPDLVVAWRSGNRAGDIARLESLGIPVYVTEARRLEDIPRHLIALGRLSGTEAVARQAAADFNRQLQALRREFAQQPSVDVFYQVWPQPLITVGGLHLISEVIRGCGGRNIFAAETTLAPVVSVEPVLAANPQVIVAASTAGGADPLERWHHYPQLGAVRNNQLYRIDADLIHRATPRILDGARIICESLKKSRGQNPR